MKKYFQCIFIIIVVVFILNINIAKCFELKFAKIKEAYLQSYNYEKMGNYKDAIRVLLSIYNSSPNSYLINLRLGWLYYLSGKYANSIIFYQKSLKIMPESIEALLGMSLPLIAQKRFNEVETLMYEVIKNDFYNYFGNLRLAMALRYQQKLDQAEKIAKKMLRFYPTDINFLLELGIVERSKGNIQKARSIFKEVLLLDPLNRIARYSLNSLTQSR